MKNSNINSIEVATSTIQVRSKLHGQGYFCSVLRKIHVLIDFNVFVYRIMAEQSEQPVNPPVDQPVQQHEQQEGSSLGPA